MYKYGLMSSEKWPINVSFSNVHSRCETFRS